MSDSQHETKLQRLNTTNDHMPLNRFIDIRLKELFDFVSDVNKEAYVDVYMLSNQVLNKNVFIDSLLDDYLEEKDVDEAHFPKILLNIILYYGKSFFRFGQYLIEKYVHFLSDQRYDPKAIDDEIILIDTFLLGKKILQEGSFVDPYFSGLDKLLKKQGKAYAYLPVFCSYNSIWSFIKILNLLKRENAPVLTEYQLLSLQDMARLFLFILVYPFRVLRLAHDFKVDSYITRFLKYKLISSLRYSTFNSFSRYLQGRRVSSLPGNIKIISWCENQTIHKNLYRGLREGNGESHVYIYGCQLFIYPFSFLSINVDPSEKIHNTLPDKVLVNGNAYLYRSNNICSDIGPSFRYRKIFDKKIAFEKRNSLLFVLPYFVDEINNIINVIASMDCVTNDVIVKFHPTTDVRKYQQLLPAGAKISNENVYDLFLKAKIILGAASGALVEAVSLAIPVIVLKGYNKTTHNYLPECGRGVVWDYARNMNEVNKLLDKYYHKIDYEKDVLLQYAEKYKKMFFCEPTEGKIIEAFDL